MTPSFSPAVYEYETSTSNATNTIAAEAADETATVEITVNGDSHENGEPATWDEGENTVIITVTDFPLLRTYTVIVTKQEA